MKIFVYGTLKRGYGNNRLLQDAQFLGEALTNKNYQLLGNGIPFAIPEETGLPIKGEVWEVDVERDLPRLDRLEGHPTFYTRTLISATLNGDEDVEVSIYEMHHKGIYTSPPCNIKDGYYYWGQ